MPENIVNRRNVLKKIGATTIGTTLATGTVTGAVSGDDVKVYIDFARSSDESTAKNEVYNAIDGFLTRLENEGAIPGYELSIAAYPVEDFFSDPGRTSDECNPSGLYDNYVDEYNDGDNDDYWDLRVYVTDDAMYAGGEVGMSEGVWEEESKIVWVGTSGNYGADTDDISGRIKNASIQEPGHTLIDHTKIDYNYDSLAWNHQEHALGQVYDDSSRYGLASPMLVYYETSQAGGSCNSTGLQGEGGCTGLTAWNSEHSQEVTSCTVDAVRDTMSAHW